VEWLYNHRGLVNSLCQPLEVVVWCVLFVAVACVGPFPAQRLLCIVCGVLCVVCYCAVCWSILYASGLRCSVVCVVFHTVAVVCCAVSWSFSVCVLCVFAAHAHTHAHMFRRSGSTEKTFG